MSTASSSLPPPQNYDDQSQNSRLPHIFGRCNRANIPKFPKQQTSNKAAFPPQHRLHQRRQHPRPHIDLIESSRLCFDHFQMTEKRQEIRHRHAMENVRPHHVPGQTLGFNYHSDPFIQRHKSELTRLSCTTQKQHHQHHIGDGCKSSQRWHRRNW